MSQAVVSIEEFKKKYGSRGFKTAIEHFILRAPEFEGDNELAIQIGIMCADLESALQNPKT